jgi:Mannosyl-glycoprotein endo-beta-N-acetylglucosaminidase
MKLTRLILICFLFASVKGFAQNGTEAVSEYIDQYKGLAMEEMQRKGVPASIILAQGILETEAGKSDLVLKSNNHFGIKCKMSWTGEKVYHDDDSRGECFRKYASAEDSYYDHSDYLRNTARYASLFKLEPTDYKGWAYGLKSAGYATNPKYPQILIKYIEQYNLNDYTLIALGRKPASESIASSNAAGQPSKGVGSGSVFLDNINVSSSASTVSGAQSQPGSETKTAPVVSYPDGEFRINNTRVIYVKSGASLLALAEQHDIKYKWLLDFNEIKNGNDLVLKDQLIYLQRKRKQGQEEFHIMENGEDLYMISQLEGIRLESLLDYNQLSLDMKPVPGEKIYLQQQAPARPKLAFVQ